MKMRWAYVTAFAACSVAAAVVFTISSLRSGHSRPRISSRGDVLAAAQVPPPARPSKSFGARLRAQVPAPTPQLEMSDEHAKGATDPEPTDPEVISSEQYHALVNAAFEKQSPDPVWARDAAFEISQTVLPLIENEASHASRVDCRRDLCRFEVKNRDETAARTAASAVTHQTVWNSGWMVTRSPTDPNTFTVILAKKGQEIPNRAEL